MSELGRIHAMLPLKEIAQEIALHFPKKHPQGNIDSEALSADDAQKRN